MNQLLNSYRLYKFTIFFVATVLSSISNAADDGAIRGLVKPQKQAQISSEIAARVVSIPFSAGESFTRGDVLVKLECALYRAQFDAAAADRDAKVTQYENAEELLSYRAISPLEVALMKSDMQQSVARFEMEQQSVRGCQVIAPYDGRVVDLEVNEHESVAPGSKLISILSNESLEVELIVPSGWLSWLAKGAEFEFQIDETGETHTAVVDRIGAMVDPVSQTIQVVGEFKTVSDNVLAGMSGSAVFDQGR